MHLFLIALTVASSTFLGNTLYDLIKTKRAVKRVSTYHLTPSEIKAYSAQSGTIKVYGGLKSTFD